MEDLVSNTTGFFNNYTFANYSEISNKIQLRNLGMLNDKGKAQLKNIHNKLLKKNINIENLIFEDGITFKKKINKNLKLK